MGAMELFVYRKKDLLEKSKKESEKESEKAIEKIFDNFLEGNRNEPS